MVTKRRLLFDPKSFLAKVGELEREQTKYRHPPYGLLRRRALALSIGVVAPLINCLISAFICALGLAIPRGCLQPSR